MSAEQGDVRLRDPPGPPYYFLPEKGTGTQKITALEHLRTIESDPPGTPGNLKEIVEHLIYELDHIPKEDLEAACRVAIATVATPFLPRPAILMGIMATVGIAYLEAIIKGEVEQP